MEPSRNAVLIIADPHELEQAGSVWGTGGWLPPDERRALDWFTLCRLMGLPVSVTPPEEYDPERMERDIKWLIIACGPARVGDDLVRKLKATVERNPIVVIGQAFEKGTPFAEWLMAHSTHETIQGREIATRGRAEGCDLICRSPVEVRGMAAGDHAEIVGLLEESPLAFSIDVDKGSILVLGFDPSELRDVDGVVTRLLQHFILSSSPDPTPWVDWRNTLVLRMDDPGSSEAIYNHAYDNTKLGAAEWAGVGRELTARGGRMSVGYVTGWVDAGECVRGTLLVNGRVVPRTRGKVYPSPTVRFDRDREGAVVSYDHAGEFNALEELRRSGLVEVEMHGYTHVFPDREAWLNAHDRHSNNSWYREFGAKAVRFFEQNPDQAHPVDEALKVFESYFKSRPSVLICPGEEFTNHVLIKALNEGITLVSSYYLAMAVHGRFCWTQHVCAPYLDAADPKWFDSGLPVVGYFHDFDIARTGVGWFARCLDQWRKAGAGRIIDLSELNAVLNMKSGILRTEHGWELSVGTDEKYPLPRPFELSVYFPDGCVPSEIPAVVNNRRGFLTVAQTGRHTGRVMIPDRWSSPPVCCQQRSQSDF